MIPNSSCVLKFYVIFGTKWEFKELESQFREASLFMGQGGATPGEKFDMVSRIVLWDTLEYSFWTPIWDFERKIWGFKISRPLGIGPSKFSPTTNLPTSSSAKLSF